MNDEIDQLLSCMPKDTDADAVLDEIGIFHRWNGKFELLTETEQFLHQFFKFPRIKTILETLKEKNIFDNQFLDIYSKMINFHKHWDLNSNTWDFIENPSFQSFMYYF